jgi:hypothetical protein
VWHGYRIFFQVLAKVEDAFNSYSANIASIRRLAYVFRATRLWEKLCKEVMRAEKSSDLW